MSEMNTTKLKTLALAATPGPWRWWTRDSLLRLTGGDGNDGGVLHAYTYGSGADISCTTRDQAFIEAANPTAILRLLGKVEKVLIERDTLRQGYTSASARVCELEAELERLRAAQAEPATPGLIRPGVGEAAPQVERRRYLDGGME
jgi:hypothetical protein